MCISSCAYDRYCERPHYSELSGSQRAPHFGSLYRDFTLYGYVHVAEWLEIVAVEAISLPLTALWRCKLAIDKVVNGLESDMRTGTVCRLDLYL